MQCRQYRGRDTIKARTCTLTLRAQSAPGKSIMRQAANDLILSFPTALPFLPWETIVYCCLERFQIHGLSCRKIWFVVIFVPLNLFTRVRMIGARAQLSWLIGSSHIHHVIDACIPVLYYSEDTRCICILENFHGSVQRLFCRCLESRSQSFQKGFIVRWVNRNCYVDRD